MSPPDVCDLTHLFQGPPLQTTIRSQCRSWWITMPSNTAVGCLGILMPSVILWNLWKLYNQVIHNNISPSISKIQLDIRLGIKTITLAHPMTQRVSTDDSLLREGLRRSFAPPKRRIPTLVSWQCLPPDV